MLAANAVQEDPVSAVVKAENGRIVFSGKIADVTRKTAAGFVRGDLILTELLAGGAEQGGKKPARECKLHFRECCEP
eukprot:COSAG06_NODE_17882_length_916_cov_0.864137_2_plen_77_part_00